MKYIVYNKETLRVRKDGILDKEPTSITANLGIARAETVPNGDILTVTNIKPQTEKYLAKQSKEVEVKDEETGETYEDVVYEDIELEREYFTCEVVATKDEKKEIYIQIQKLKNWFNTNYRMYSEMLTRRQALGIVKFCDDKVRGKVYFTLDELYQEAEKVVNEITELEMGLING
jgi:hypothetical protein